MIHCTRLIEVIVGVCVLVTRVHRREVPRMRLVENLGTIITVVVRVTGGRE